MAAKQKDKTNYISLASVLSCIAVVFLHTNGCFWRFDSDAGYWFSANIIESVFYYAVPVFFMIPGVTLLDFYERYTLKDYLEKRVKKTVIPYVVWSLIGLLYQIITLKTIQPEEVTPRYIVEGLFNGNLVSVYWFFIPLFAVYLSLPLIALVPREKRHDLFKYLVYVGLVFNILCPFIITVFSFNLHFPLQVTVVSGHLIYVIIGWLINEDKASKGMKTLIYCLALAGLLVHSIGTYKVSMEAGTVLRTFKGYLSLPCVLYSAGVFQLFRNKGDVLLKNKVVRKLTQIISKYTFSIYLLHVFVLRTATIVFKMDDTTLAFRLIAPFLIICICILITAIIRKIPFLKWMLPV